MAHPTIQHPPKSISAWHRLSAVAFAFYTLLGTNIYAQTNDQLAIAQHAVQASASHQGAEQNISNPDGSINDIGNKNAGLLNTGSIHGASIDSRWNKLTKTPLYFQFQLGSSSESDFPQAAVLFEFDASQEKNYISAVSVGKKVSDYMWLWPFDVVAYASFQHFNDRGYQPNGWGATLFAKAYQTFNIPYVGIPMRLGFGNGLSYVSRIPVSEVRDSLPDRSEKLVYYMDYSLQTSLSHLVGRGHRSWSSNIEDIYVGYTVWHRSTVFGLFGDTTTGTNYQGLSIETVFR